MNPFHIIGIAAKEGRLPATMNADYYASDAFRERVQFIGEAGAADQLAILLYMLRHVALDPRHADQARTYLGTGLVWLQFYGVSNPVPLLQLPVGSPELAEVTRAIDANLNGGPLARAATRVTRRRLNNKKRNAQESRILERLRSSLPWPGPNDFRGDPAKARAKQTELIDIIQAKRDQLHDRYMARSSALAQALMPGAKSWTDLVTNVALNALRPN